MSDTRRSLYIEKFGGYDALKVRTEPVPVPAADDRNWVRVDVQACGLNFAEILARQGLYPNCSKTPAILGYECAGIVLSVGPDVTTFSVGDRVVCVNNFGLFSSQVLVPAAQCFPIPDSISFADAAAIPVNYVTAHLLLHELGGLAPGHRVLIHMAAGGVGTAATQLARLVDGVTIIGTCSASKHDRVRAAGVDVAIDYRTADYAEVVRGPSGTGRVDLVLDPLGGADTKKCSDLLAPLGKVVCYGAANMLTGEKKSIMHVLKEYWRFPKFGSMDLMTKNRGVLGLHVGNLINEAPETFTRVMNRIMGLLRDGKIKPVVDSSYSFDEARAAQERMVNRLNVGKVILVPSQPQAEPTTPAVAADSVTVVEAPATTAATTAANPADEGQGPNYVTVGPVKDRKEFVLVVAEPAAPVETSSSKDLIPRNGEQAVVLVTPPGPVVVVPVPSTASPAETETVAAVENVEQPADETAAAAAEPAAAAAEPAAAEPETVHENASE